jgi:hypothetical protein
MANPTALLFCPHGCHHLAPPVVAACMANLTHDGVDVIAPLVMQPVGKCWLGELVHDGLADAETLKHLPKARLWTWPAGTPADPAAALATIGLELSHE